MITEYGIYTVLGSKPMTAFNLPQIVPEEQRKEFYDAMPDEFRKKISFTNFNDHTEINELWQNWLKIQNNYLNEHFKIVYDQSWESGFLINIPLVTYTLKDHYQDFSDIFGGKFDPNKAVHEIGIESSDFWNKIKTNHHLLGLLFGFGEKNAKLFQWESENLISFPFRIGSNEIPSVTKKHHRIRMYGKIENLDIPQFTVYQPIDEVVEKYLLEKDRILQIYKGKDFAETTILYLKGKAIDEINKNKKFLRIKRENGRLIVETSIDK